MLPIRIMLVDDNPEFLQIAREILNEDFSVVGTFQDGSSVEPAAVLLQPDVVVLDLSLGDMSGFEVARRLKQAGSEARIVFFTVHESEDFVHAAKLLGAHGYVFKSRAAVDLTIAVVRAFNGKTFFPFGDALAG